MRSVILLLSIHTRPHNYTHTHLHTYTHTLTLYISQVHPVLAHALTHVPAAALGANDDDDVERFHDVDDDEEEDGDGDGRAQHAKHNGEKSTPASDDNESGDDEEHGDDESDDNEKKDDDNEKQKGQQKVNKGGGHEGLSVHGGQRKGGQRKGGNAEYDIHKRYVCWCFCVLLCWYVHCRDGSLRM